MPEIAEPLLVLTTERLNERHQISIAWDESEAAWHSDSYGRSAIEPHEQDEITQDVDALINTARECLEWLAANTPVIAGAWCNRYVSSSAPLLRRLAIHALSARIDLTADDKIAWLLKHCDIHESQLTTRYSGPPAYPIHKPARNNGCISSEPCGPTARRKKRNQTRIVTQHISNLNGFIGSARLTLIAS